MPQVKEGNNSDQYPAAARVVQILSRNQRKRAKSTTADEGKLLPAPHAPSLYQSDHGIISFWPQMCVGVHMQASACSGVCIHICMGERLLFYIFFLIIFLLVDLLFICPPPPQTIFKASGIFLSLILIISARFSFCHFLLLFLDFSLLYIWYMIPLPTSD